MRMERFIKKQKSRKLLETLIKEAKLTGAIISVGKSPAHAGLIRGSLVQVQQGEQASAIAEVFL